MELKETVVIITGSGTGIGRATASLFAKRGATIVACGRRPNPLKETMSLINQRSCAGLALVCDVTDWAQVTNVIEKTVQRFGRVDILVNNAGIAIAKPLVETTGEEWDEVLATNLKGLFLCCKAVLPAMVEAGRGVIVNVSSILGKRGIANLGAYCASKFGVIGLTEALADEYNERGIRAYAVCPGPTYTDLHRKIVGEEAAKVAMPPEKVGAKIIDVVTGKIHLPSGSAILIDEQPLGLASREAKERWRQRARRWLKPASLILRRVVNLVH